MIILFLSSESLENLTSLTENIQLTLCKCYTQVGILHQWMVLAVVNFSVSVVVLVIFPATLE